LGFSTVLEQNRTRFAVQTRTAGGLPGPVANSSPGVFSDQAIKWIRGTENLQLEIIDANHSKSPEQAEKFAKICDLNASLFAKVKDLEETEPIRDSPIRELPATQRDIVELEEELQNKKCRSAKLETRLDKCKSEPETKEQTDIAQLRLEKEMLLHQIKDLSSERSGLESELRAFERVIQRLMTNQVHATPARNTSQPPPGLFWLCDSSVPTSGLFGTRGSTEPTPCSSGNRGFSVMSSNLLMYEGKRNLDDVTTFLSALERHFKNAAQAIGWVGTTGWGEHTVLQLKGDAAVWAMHRFPMSAAIKWSTVCTGLKAEFIPSNALDLVKRESEVQKGGRVTEFTQRFHHLRSKLDPHQPIPVEMLADAY